MTQPSPFKLCSTCRAPIAYGAKYYRCSVSTCNKKVTALYFCSVPCWDAHVPDARHRDAWAEEEQAPGGPPAATDSTAVAGRRVVSGRSQEASDTSTIAEVSEANLPKDVLVVMSKLKGYIKAKSNLRTSDGVSDPLSDHIREICTQAIRSAAANGRGTVLARDIEAAKSGGTASE